MNKPLQHNELLEYFCNEIDFEATATPHWIEAEFWCGLRPAVWGLLAQVAGAVGTLWAFSCLLTWLLNLPK